MSEGVAMKEIMHIYARNNIKTDAKTYLEIAKVFRGQVKVVPFNFSKTRAHWEEKLLASEDAEAIVYHVDISNSGKHYCRVLKISGTNVEVVEEARGGWCPIHHADP